MSFSLESSLQRPCVLQQQWHREFSSIDVNTPLLHLIIARSFSLPACNSRIDLYTCSQLSTML